MEIRVKNPKIILETMKRYIDAVGQGKIPYPKCILCQKVEGELLGIYSKEGESSTTVYAICRSCWEKNKGSDGEDKLKATGELDDMIKAKIVVVIEQLLKDNLPNEIFRMIPEEWVN